MKQEAIALSEGEFQKRVNEASGRAEEIRLVAQATAEGIRSIAAAITETPGGQDAVNLRLAEQYINEFGKLAKESSTVVVPADVADVAGFIKAAVSTVRKG